MGPRPDGRGTCAPPPDDHNQVRGFNGAATGWPRNAACGTTKKRASLASMGPRPDGRGTRHGPGTAASRGQGFNGAATGWPRNAINLPFSTRYSRCFNGAATGWPRNASTVVPAASAAASLQWGRDRMAAERFAFASPYMRCTCALQWGRDRMAAERELCDFCGQWSMPASMGPRPDGRGTLPCWIQCEGRTLASMGPRPDGRGTGSFSSRACP